jgi:short-subunit dehydrogenase
VLVARSAHKLEEVAKFIAGSHPEVETLPVPTDIADPVSVAALFETVVNRDVLINNAGIFKAIGPVENVDQTAWWDEMASIAST